MKPVYFLFLSGMLGMLSLVQAASPQNQLEHLTMMTAAVPGPADTPCCEPCPTDTTGTPNRSFLSGRDIWGVMLPYSDQWTEEDAEKAKSGQPAPQQVNRKECVKKEKTQAERKTAPSYLRPPFMLR